MRRASMLIAAIALTAFSASAATQDTVRKTFNVGDGGTITLDADVGDIHVTSGGSGTVSVEILREVRSGSRSRAEDVLRDHEVSFDQNGNDVKIRSRYDRDHGWFQWSTPLSVRYNIRVPARYNLNLGTSGGDINAGDINGDVDVHTSGGDLEIGRINGTLRANTSGGDVTIESATGAINAHTSGGDIEIHGSGASIEAKTSGGTIEIRRAGGSVFARSSGGGIRIEDATDTVDASTSGGSIVAKFSRQPRGDSRLSTSGGGVTVELAPSINAEIDAHTSGGSVHSDVPVTIQGTQDNDTLKGRIGAGGPRMVLRSSGGGISLRRG
jgi:DUF4097 and DUF4098 domain-containing protein YvlB